MSKDPPTSSKPLNVLFLCTGNACRSQMAEGFARHLHPQRIEAYSAGTKPEGINPHAVKVMAERGVDLHGQRSKSLDDLQDIKFDWIVTVCDRAAENCPVPRADTKILVATFDDPPSLPAVTGDPLEPYRRVRDEIGLFVETLVNRLAEESS